jgi:Holliday junction resolvasome RuvABC endonuclease subunit
MICVGIDPGSEHCAFTVIKCDSFMELKDEAFEEVVCKEKITVVESITVQTITTPKASVHEITTVVCRTLDNLISKYANLQIAVEIQPFTGGTRQLRSKTAISYITKQSLLNVVVESVVLAYSTSMNRQCYRVAAIAWQKDNKVKAKDKSFTYYKNLSLDTICGLALLTNEHEFDAMFIAKSVLFK